MLITIYCDTTDIGRHQSSRTLGASLKKFVKKSIPSVFGAFRNVRRAPSIDSVSLPQYRRRDDRNHRYRNSNRSRTAAAVAPSCGSRRGNGNDGKSRTGEQTRRQSTRVARGSGAAIGGRPARSRKKNVTSDNFMRCTTIGERDRMRGSRSPVGRRVRMRARHGNFHIISPSPTRSPAAVDRGGAAAAATDLAYGGHPIRSDE